LDGTLRETNGGHELRFERHLKHPVEEVWAALTEPERLVAWLAQAEVELAPGGRVQLTWLNSPSVARGTVTAFDPPRLVEYSTDIHGRLRWELQPEGHGCLLTFTCTLADNIKEHLARNLAGWHVHLDHLADALEGHTVDWPRWTEDYMGRWTEYHDRYAAKLAKR
jgi:uncharacterized protein YndB with AHSA1/START domain